MLLLKSTTSDRSVDKVGGQAVLGRQNILPTPWLTERHGYDPTSSLRASTRVSPGFTLFRHRSPSFGSQQICSYSNLPQVIDRSIVPRRENGPDGSYLTSRSSLHFHYASGFNTQILAYMLDSLVRVSRRVNENHFVRIAKCTSG